MSFPSGSGSGFAVGNTGYAPVTYQRLMRLAARAFYSGPCPPPGRDNDNTFSARSKIAKMDTRGLGIVLVDYLTTVEWTSFELLSEALRLHPVVLSRALRFLEAGHMIRRYERRESRRKKRTVVGEALEADVAQAPDSDEEEDDEGAKKKGLLTEYFTVDYARAFDALQVRIHSMRASLKEQLEATNAIQAYRCPGAFCGKTYTSLDAANLVDPMDGTFKCEMCGSELMEQRATNDALAGGEAAQHATAKESKEAARKLLQAIDRELAPITRLMAELQHRAVPLPDPGELFEWAQRVKLREAELAAATGGGAAGGPGGSNGGGGGAGAGRGPGGGGAGGAGAGIAPAALLAGSGVTVLNAADNTNTWEAQDFKVSLDGGLLGGGALGGLGAGAGAAGAGLQQPVGAGAGAGAGGGKKGTSALPWFMKASEGKAAAGEDGPAASTSGAPAAAPDGGKQQQQAEYFRDFMAYMSNLQKEKDKRTEAGAAAALKPEPGPSPASMKREQLASQAAGFGLEQPFPAPVIKPEPGLAAPVPLGPVSVAEVKTEPGMFVGTAPVAAAAAADVVWEDIGGSTATATAGGFGAGPLQAGQLIAKPEDGVKQEPGAAFGGSGAGGGDVDGDVEWEDV